MVEANKWLKRKIWANKIPKKRGEYVGNRSRGK